MSAISAYVTFSSELPARGKFASSAHCNMTFTLICYASNQSSRIAIIHASSYCKIIHKRQNYCTDTMKNVFNIKATVSIIKIENDINPNETIIKVTSLIF